MRFVKKMMKLGKYKVPVSVAIGKPITMEEFDRRTKPIFLKMAKRMGELEKQGKRISRKV